MTKCTVPVKMQNILDFEKQTSISVTAIVENKDGGKLVEVFEVNIENENEAPKVRTWDLAFFFYIQFNWCIVQLRDTGLLDCRQIDLKRLKMLLQFAFVLRFAFLVQILIFVPMYLVGHSAQQYRPVCPGEFQGPDGHHVLGFRPRCWGYTFLHIAGKPWSKLQSEHTWTAFCSQRYSILHCSLYFSLRILLTSLFLHWVMNKEGSVDVAIFLLLAVIDS